MPNVSLEECLAKTEKWLKELETTGKSSSSNAVSKAANSLTTENRQHIVSTIANEILELIGNNERKGEAVNVINGCFDNFPIALNAVMSIFKEIVAFLGTTCLSYFNDPSSFTDLSHKEMVSVVHGISRVGTLVLKSQKSSENFDYYRDLSITCTDFICNVDDLAMDTKINMAMILWLMRENTAADLKKVHEEFVEALFNSQDDYNGKLLKFVMAAGSVNLWVHSIIEIHHTVKYLDFFLTLVEEYGNETGLVVMIIRCLQTLSTHSEFLQNDASQAKRLVSCVMMLLEHSIPCVRHNSRDLLRALVRVPILRDEIQKSVLETTPDKKSFYLGLAALGRTGDARAIVKISPDLPNLLVNRLSDPTSVPHVVSAIENLALNDSLLKNELEWIQLWILPLLHKIDHCLPIVASEIEKLLLKLFRNKPDVISLVLESIERDNFRSAMVCFKIRNQIQGVGFPQFREVYTDDEIEMILKNGEDDIRLDGFSLMFDRHIEETDLKFVNYFLKYNLNNHKPATRQRVMTMFRRFVPRCCKAIANAKNAEAELPWIECLKNLVEFCYENIFAEANFNRLNTVLTILDICRENFDENLSTKCELFDGKRWVSFQTALCSTFEENQILASELAKNLKFSEMELNDLSELRQCLRVAFGHIQALEPPRVLIGTYTLYVLLHVPNAGKLLRMNFSDNIDKPSQEVFVLGIQILARYLSLQITEAKQSITKAAKNSPMYGTMLAIRLLLKQLKPNHLELPETKIVLQQLIDLSFKMADAVAIIVNNSSPEGHLPMDFQNLGQDEDDMPKEPQIFEYGPNSDISMWISNYKTAETAEEKLMLAERIRGYYEEKIDKLMSTELNYGFFSENHFQEWLEFLRSSKHGFNEYDCYFKEHLPRIIEEPPVTAQALLLFSWRSMKEACLCLGDLVSRIPLKTSLDRGILTQEDIIKIGSKLRLLLSEIRHRGAFEQAEVGLSALCRSLWEYPTPPLQQMPAEWLKEILDEIVRPPDQQTLKLSSTRRSAGLPFLIQAIITTQIASKCAPNSQILNQTMTLLLNITENLENNLETRLHALNIMRALFQNAELGEFVFPFISKALEIAIYGSRSETWSERNCSNMLFRALIIRIFGVSRSRDELSKKNKMTSTTFFQRFPELFDVLYQELKRADLNTFSSNGVTPEPSLYLVLLLMGRLYPSSDANGIDLSPFLHLMGRCAANPIMRIRLSAARALVPFVPAHKLRDEITWRLDILKRKTSVSTNLRHGLLLQVIQLVTETKSHLDWKTKLDGIDLQVSTLIEDNLETMPFPVLHSLYQLRILLFDKSSKPITPKIQNFLNNPHLNFGKIGIGVEACLATKMLFNLQSIAYEENEEVWKEMLKFKDCKILLIENTVFQFLYHFLTPRQQWDSDFDFFLLENNVQKCVPDSTPKLPDSLWRWYQQSEAEKLFHGSNVHQRQLRILIIAQLVELEKGYHANPLNGGLALLSLFSQCWGPETKNVKWLNTEMDKILLLKSLLTRVVLRMELLLDGDKYCRLAVVSMFNKAIKWLLPGDQQKYCLEIMEYWMILFRVLIDEDEQVRKAALDLVLNLCIENQLLPKKFKLTALAAQELLIESYKKCNISPTIGVDLLTFAVFTIQPPEEDGLHNDILEIFKKGNPNPFNETVALTKMFVNAAKNYQIADELEKPFCGDVEIVNSIHYILSPHFAVNGLRMKPVTTPIRMLNDLARLELPENAENFVFWCQRRLLLSLIPK